MLYRSPRALTPLLVGLLAFLTALVTTPASAAKPAPTTPPATVTPSADLPRGWGVSMPGMPWDTTAIATLSNAVGDIPDTVMWYDAWANNTPFPVATAHSLNASGVDTLAVTWEPWNPANGVTQPTYTAARIASGKFDAYIRSYAKALKEYGKPVTIRYAHEMNGNWYPWSVGVNGNRASDYVAAYRRVVGIFDAQGATNVSWAWTPNVPFPGSTPMAAAYPGDAYVDQVGLDGYNWANLQPGSTWTSFWDVFGPGVAQLQALTTRPIWLGEVGAPEAGGDKAAWVTDMFTTLAAHPEVRGFTWFSYNKEADWRIDSSPATVEAFRTGLATY